jgi:hypothetical protein
MQRVVGHAGEARHTTLAAGRCVSAPTAIKTGLQQLLLKTVQHLVRCQYMQDPRIECSMWVCGVEAAPTAVPGTALARSLVDVLLHIWWQLLGRRVLHGHPGSGQAAVSSVTPRVLVTS